MPAYSRYNVAQLRDICDERSLAHDGLTKRQLVALLCRDDEQRSVENDDFDQGDVESESSGEVELGENLRVGSGVDTGNHSVIPAEDEPDESNSIQALRLKLALVQAQSEMREREVVLKEREFEIERERAAMQCGPSDRSVRQSADAVNLKQQLPIMNDNDALSFFMMFERIMDINSIDKALWAKWLAPQLTPKAMKAFLRLSSEESRDYNAVKRSVLSYFQLNASSYLRAFRTARRTGRDTYRMTLSKLRDLQTSYFESAGIDSFESLKDAMLTEQFLSILTPEIKQFVWAKRPANSEQSAIEADLAYDCSKINESVARGASWGMDRGNKVDAGTRMVQQALGSKPKRHTFGGQGSPGVPAFQQPAMRQQQKNGTKPTCWTCNSVGHTSKNCPQRRFCAPSCLFCGKVHSADIPCPGTNRQNAAYSAQENAITFDSQFVVPTYVNNVLTNALRDSGHNGVLMVDENLVEKEQYLPGRSIKMRGAFDKDYVELPVARIFFRSPTLGCDYDLILDAAVAPMPYGLGCNIGNNLFHQFPQLRDVLNSDVCGTAVTYDRPTEILGDSPLTPPLTELNLPYNELVTNRQPATADIVTTDSEQTPDRFSLGEGTEQLWTDRSNSGGKQALIDTDAVRRDTQHLNYRERTADSAAGNPTEVTERHETTPKHGKSLRTQKRTDTNAKIVNVNAVHTRSRGQRASDDEQCSDTQTPENPTDAGDRDSELDSHWRHLADVDLSDNEPPSEAGHFENKTDFALAQKSDKTLASLWIRARRYSNEFVIIDDLLYRRNNNANSAHEFQLILPTKFRQQVLELAHDHKLSGHTGTRSMYQRVSELFFYPRMWDDIKTHVRCCEICQKTKPMHKNDRAPLQQCEVMANHPFHEVQIDILGGNLPRSRSGHKYLLTIICSATKWIHGIPLRNLRADTLANKLVEFFCTFGLPKIIKCDNMAGFKAELWTQVRNKLGITAQYSTPWHFQSHGLIERANRTIEDILRKYINLHSEEWDVMLPYILFAIRNVAHSGSKISANELVFGHKLRNLLEVARETWIGEDTVKKQLKTTTIDYLQNLQRRLETAMQVANDNALKAHDAAKRQFDKHCSQRSFNVGDKVLVLLPTSNDKLRAAWRGPYLISQRFKNNNYEVDMGRRKAILHVNILRRFYEHASDTDNDTDNPTPINMIVAETDDGAGDGIEELPNPHDGGGPSDVMIGDEMTTEQRQRVTELLSQYGDVLTDVPGRTDLIQHHIKLTDPTPVYQNSYKIPQDLEGAVEAELQRMLTLGIIQYDPNSSYNNPVVIVRKRDGKNIRLCNNFIQLNSKTVNEQHPTVNSADLICRVAGARWLTRWDMVQSYYQIPLSPESQPLTAFKTPYGNFSYRVLCFGLKCAGATCQKLMEFVLRGTHRFAGVMIDDIITFSKTFEEHLEHIKTVLDRIRKAGLTLNAKKCHVATNKIRLFGFEICNGIVTPDDEKIRAVKNWPVPNTRRQLKSFLGFCGYFRTHVAAFSEKAMPLIQLVNSCKGNKLAWEKTHQLAFDTLRNALITKPVLRAADPTKAFEIFVDAAKTNSISAILLQRENTEDKTGYAISYCSRKLEPREQRYPTIELELLAIVYALQKFRYWVYNKKVIVHTDHRPLEYLNSLSKHSSRLARYNLILQEYDIETRYIQGKNQLADHLTRL